MNTRIFKISGMVGAVLSLGACNCSEDVVSARGYFDQNVVAELQQSCGSTSCHGVPLEQYEESQLIILAVSHCKQQQQIEKE